MSEIEWSRLKASEIGALAQRNAIVIVPIGATEQHGPHLPSMVDWRCAQEVAHRAARLIEKTTPVVVAPTIPYGMSEHHMSLSGTITLDYATLYAVIRCVVTSAVRHGFKRIFVLNGHGGNTTALQNMVGELTVEYIRGGHLLGHRRQVDRQALGQAEGAVACLRGGDRDDHGDGARAGES
jgi:creatinine amidohydrolase